MKLEIISKFASAPTTRPPIVFVHGVCHGAWCWDEHFLDFFAAHGFDAHALSLRGHGTSEGRDKLARFRLADYVDDLRQVIASLPNSPILIGHSMGGAIIQKHLETATAPAAVLLASMPPGGVWRPTLALMLQHPLISLRCQIRQSMLELFGTTALFQAAFFSPSMPLREAERHASRVQEESFMAFLDMLFLDLPRPKRIKGTPIQVVGAENDRIFSVRQMHQMAAQYGTQATIVPDMAHDMMLESDWETVAQAILHWLNGLRE